MYMVEQEQAEAQARAQAAAQAQAHAHAQAQAQAQAHAHAQAQAQAQAQAHAQAQAAHAHAHAAHLRHASLDNGLPPQFANPISQQVHQQAAQQQQQQQQREREREYERGHERELDQQNQHQHQHQHQHGHQHGHQQQVQSHGQGQGQNAPPHPDSLAAVSKQEPVEYEGRLYSLEVVQQPIRARMCGFGDKVGVLDRRPITPPPCVRLIVRDAVTKKELDPSEVDTSFFVLTVDLWSADGTHEVNL
ncbi:hypothetical protein KEM52_004086, partial [Ascosphaera acerosa]